ncbi:DUF4097 family beta strand repeat-containing protein [Lysinibacillus yapensis]|uniref:DUF4097 family beta strand repeat-containing protein n=1 Tax=Ureibacillus yapensis TaxID=2304605 RepID=UPI001314CB74|nr:DUF4097 family beta strand repeat-containing protein [Lysinibacillus yapensis]
MENKKVFIWVTLIAIVAVLIFNFYKNGKKEDLTIAQDFSNVEVESDTANILIMPADGEEAEIELDNKRYTADVKMQGDTLKIDVESKWFKWFTSNFFSKNATVSIRLPNKEYSTIKAETDNGTMKATGIKVGNFIGETDNGEVIIEDMASREIFAKSDNGNLVIDESSGTIKGETSNGNLVITTENLDRPMELDTDNGEIYIKTTDKPKNAKINVDTDNGFVNVFGQFNSETVFGKGENVIKLTSNNGSIIVE